MELFISHSAEPQHLAEFFASVGTAVRIVHNVSVRKTGEIEHGYAISFERETFDRETFKEQVWEPLKTRCSLTCAFVKVPDEYMGCIYNWPEVFSPSLCGEQHK